MTAQRSRKKQPTQADVARRAGVSQATVSYVLNNSSTIAVLLFSTYDTIACETPARRATSAWVGCFLRER